MWPVPWLAHFPLFISTNCSFPVVLFLRLWDNMYQLQTLDSEPCSMLGMKQFEFLQLNNVLYQESRSVPSLWQHLLSGMRFPLDMAGLHLWKFVGTWWPGFSYRTLMSEVPLLCVDFSPFFHSYLAFIIFAVFYFLFCYTHGLGTLEIG